MGNEISTAGAIISYAFETVSGTRPVTGYQRIPNIKSTPDLNPEPSSLEVTDLADTEWKRYIQGMKDPGGALGFNANNTDEFQAAWITLCHYAEDAADGDLATWFCIDVPGLDNAFYFAAVPSALGVVGMDVDTVLEVTAFVSPNAVHGWDDKPTKYAAYIRGFIRKNISVATSPLEISVAITPPEAEIDSASALTAGVVTVYQQDATTLELTRDGTGTTYVEVVTDAGANHTAGKAMFEIVSV